MSFILNALRKSEQERASSYIDTLEGKIQLKQETPSKNKPGWLIILVLMNLALLAFLLWNFTQQEEKATDIKPVTVAEQPITPRQIKQKKTVEVQTPKLDSIPQVTIAQQIKNHQKQQKEVHQQQASLKPNPIIPPVKAKRTTPLAPQKSTTDQLEKPKKPKLMVSNKKSEPVYLSDMPYEFSLSVPYININVFVYTEQPEDRFIMIDMQKYQEGQHINKDMKLHEIRPDSIVVEFKDEVFQIPR